MSPSVLSTIRQPGSRRSPAFADRTNGFTRCCGTEIAEVPLSLKQRDVIRPGCRHEPQLRDVVLPEADWADIVRAGRLLKHEVTATGAGVRAHSVVSFGRSRLTTQAQRPPGRERGTWNRCASYRNVSSAKRVGGSLQRIVRPRRTKCGHRGTEASDRRAACDIPSCGAR